MSKIQKITPCLWFDGNAEEAVNYYVGTFDGARMVRMTRNPKGMGRPEGHALIIEFEIAGQQFLALNGGPGFKFTEAISMTLYCDTQAELDRYWDKLIADGGAPVQCGWLKDKFGLSWQIVPSQVPQWLDGGSERGGRVLAAVMTMVKLDIATLQRAYDGK